MKWKDKAVCQEDSGHTWRSSRIGCLRWENPGILNQPVTSSTPYPSSGFLRQGCEAGLGSLRAQPDLLSSGMAVVFTLLHRIESLCSNI